MNDQFLKTIVSIDLEHIVNFLLVHNFELKGNQIELLYSEGEGEPYLNLWEVEEPHNVKVQFVIERPQDLNSNITGTLEILLDKICNRAWPDNPYDPLDYSKAIENCCPHFKSIKIDETPNGYYIILIGGICYCS